jgi:hypothetical protein
VRSAGRGIARERVLGAQRVRCKHVCARRSIGGAPFGSCGEDMCCVTVVDLPLDGLAGKVSPCVHKAALLTCQSSGRAILKEAVPSAPLLRTASLSRVPVSLRTRRFQYSRDALSLARRPVDVLHLPYCDCDDTASICAHCVDPAWLSHSGAFMRLGFRDCRHYTTQLVDCLSRWR